ncbi:MAG TPA: AgmX/PglI C-terminal domain-containing protein [Kofleriaceae bacterium]
MRSLVAVVLVLGCGNAKQPRFEGPMPVTFGACGGPTVAFVSGPRPLPFTPEQAEGKWVAAIEQARDAGIYGSLFEPSVREPDPSGFGTVGAGVRGAAGVPTGLGGLGTRYTTPHHHSAGVPTISLAPSSSSTSGFDKNTLRRYIRRNLPKITKCYLSQPLQTQDLDGALNTHFIIGADGNVTDVTTDGFDPAVGRCVADVIRGIQFPNPGGSPVVVNYPFKFRTAGADAPVPPAAPPLKPTPRASAHELFRPADAELPDSRTYDPSVGNPLRDHAQELAECFRIGPKHYGAVVVELGHGAAVTHGLDDPRTINCVVAVAKRVEHADARRCSLGFGVMPMSDVPAIDITGDHITVNGKPILDTPRTVVADNGEVASIANLAAVIDVGVDEATKISAPVVAIHGPIVVRPEDAIPMKVVERVLGSVLAAGDDFALAAHRGSGFELLMPMKFPVVPVPFGTGGRWNLVKGHDAAAADDDRATLSVLVTKQQIWVGVSRADSFVKLQPSALLDALKDHKATTVFSGRADIEIAAEGDVTYKALVDVIDTAAKAGFTDWRLTDPFGLAARPTL